MVGWHHQLNEHGFGWTVGVGDGQGGLACCGSWGHKESDTTERLNRTDEYSYLKCSTSCSNFRPRNRELRQLKYTNIYIEINLLALKAKGYQYHSKLNKVPSFIHF